MLQEGVKDNICDFIPIILQNMHVKEMKPKNTIILFI